MGLWPMTILFSCPGSSIPDLGQSLGATLEFRHKEWLFENSDPSDIWLEWCLDKKTKRQWRQGRQKDNEDNKTTKTRRQQRQQGQRRQQRQQGQQRQQRQQDNKYIKENKDNKDNEDNEDKKTRRQKPKREFDIVTTGQFRTLAMFFMLQAQFSIISWQGSSAPKDLDNCVFL